MDGFRGARARETSAAGVTVSVAEPVIEPEAAVMVVLPVPTLVARPMVGEESLMVATVATEELQCTEAVRSCVLPSLKVPVAVNCCVVPSAMEAVAGVTASETKAAATVRVVDPLTSPEAAVMVVVPVPLLVARPVVLMVATVGCEELQVTDVVRFCVLPSV